MTRPLTAPHRWLALLVAGAAILAAAPAAPALTPETGVADDHVLLAGGQAADQAVREWAANGVDIVRIHALWRRIAPART